MYEVYRTNRKTIHEHIAANQFLCSDIGKGLMTRNLRYYALNLPTANGYPAWQYSPAVLEAVETIRQQLHRRKEPAEFTHNTYLTLRWLSNFRKARLPKAHRHYSVDPFLYVPRGTNGGCDYSLFKLRVGKHLVSI